jgi:hypothetical protein
LRQDFWIKYMLRVFSGQETAQVFYHNLALVGSNFFSVPADVRSSDNVGKRKQWVVGGRRFYRESVHRCTGQVTGAQGLGQGFFVYKGSPSGVYEDSPPLHPIEGISAYHPSGFVRDRSMQAYDVAFSQELFQGDELGIVESGLVRRDVGVVNEQASAEGDEAPGNLAPYRPKAD